jgi:mono/diheme cytochrome c family protein
MLSATLLLLGACEWFTDFKDQPRIEPWEAEYQGEHVGFRGNPPNSVPMYGAATPNFIVGLGQYPMVFPPIIDSFANLANPVPIDERSLENGRKYFQINCAVCHGSGGAGDGVMLKYGVAAPTLIGDRARALTDGYLYGMIRNGRNTMPSYDRIEAMNRWDVVNYVRGLQGAAGRPVSTDSVGVPGETGPRLPGASLVAPTRPAPFVPPSGRIPAPPSTTRSAAADSAAVPAEGSGR